VIVPERLNEIRDAVISKLVRVSAADAGAATATTVLTERTVKRLRRI
jgi:hypothetical protein